MGFRDGSEDVRRIPRKAILDGRVSVPVSLLLRSAMSEARTISDPAGNQKLAKGSEGGRAIQGPRRCSRKLDPGGCRGRKKIQNSGFTFQASAADLGARINPHWTHQVGQASMSREHKKLNQLRWSRVRWAVLRRDKYRCQIVRSSWKARSGPCKSSAPGPLTRSFRPFRAANPLPILSFLQDS